MFVLMLDRGWGTAHAGWPLKRKGDDGINWTEVEEKKSLYLKFD